MNLGTEMMTKLIQKTALKRTAIVSALTAFTMLATAPLAHAQFAANSNAPITGSSDTVDYQKDVSIFSGQVDIRQADVRILADVMKVYSGGTSNNGEAFGNVDRIEAIGNFFYITPEQEVKGQQGVYERSKDIFTVTGNVILLQGEDNVVTGDRLIYNLTNNQATVTGNCQGRRCGDKGRVNILIKNTNNRSAN